MQVLAEAALDARVRERQREELLEPVLRRPAVGRVPGAVRGRGDAQRDPLVRGVGLVRDDEGVDERS